MNLTVKTQTGSYPIYIERFGLAHVGELFPLRRKCFVLTDENIPQEYVNLLLRQCGEGHLFTVPAGEGSKSLAVFEEALSRMLSASFTRSDCVIALGGGVVGDLAGFVASAYLRGVDFYNIPTTTLSQVDSSIGGKVAVNFMGLKNMVGAFYPPKGVLVDTETVVSLPARHVAAGLAESVKMAACFDEEFFEYLENENVLENLDTVIEKSLRIKKRVVEEDERESGLRKVLNFGHTVGHAIESESLSDPFPLYHGECVALGMLPMCSDSVRPRLKALLGKLGLPTRFEGDPARLVDSLVHDKKTSGETITVIRVDRIGSFRMEKMPFSLFAEEVKACKL